MSTYYDYRDVKVMIAHKLMSMEGWKVYGYKKDESDSMIDYYSPANWNGVAEKNGYILCVNVYGAAKEEEIRKYNYSGFSYSKDIQEKITKLEQMTVERGASEQEEQSAKNMIIKLQKKAETEQENNNKYIVTGTIPAHQAHPPKCNWHIEKDGIIIAKGNGILKYADIYNYYSYPQYEEDMKKFVTMSREDYKQQLIRKDMNRWNDSEEHATKSAESHIKQMEKDKKLMDQFEAFINKLDTTCGCLVGDGDLETYEKITITEYKTENKAVETTTGSIKDGQCFILKSSFNYGRYKGLVYRIREIGEEGQKYFTAYKLNRKLTKECHGMASQNNNWYIGTEDRLTKWIEKGSISWCEIQEVKTPYEVEKVVKKVIKAKTKEQPKQENKTITIDTENNNLTYNIKEDTDTRDNSKIFVVKIAEKLSRDEYLTVNNNMKQLGGYYSKFKHGFIFKNDPTELLNNDIKQCNSETQEQPIKVEEQATETKQPEVKPIDFEIEQSQHTKTKEDIWLVKIKSNLSKDDFAEIKRNFATLKGFYSSFNNSFIFKYDPTEKLQTSA